MRRYFVPTVCITINKIYSSGNDKEHTVKKTGRASKGETSGRACAIFLFVFANVITSLAQTFTLSPLLSFNSANGRNPQAGLVQGADGNFYGTTFGGGASDLGTVFKISPTGALTTLFSFNSANGRNPQAGLVQGADGNFYGTTFGGGTGDLGTVFKISPTGTLTTLVSFNSVNSVNGRNPEAGLVQGTDGNFYGTTFGGGASDLGTVFSIGSSGIPPVASHFMPVTPCRLADTRNQNGPFGGPFLAGGTTREFDIPFSACNIPVGAQAYALNVTVIPKGILGFLTIFACGQIQPVTSNLNSDGRVKAVAAIVVAGTNGGVCLFPNADTDVILDISGYFVSSARNSSGLVFFPITPCRLVDTRNASGPLGGPALAGATTRTFPLLSSTCNVPSSAQSYSLNFTALPTANGLGFLTAWATGKPQPVTSILNAPGTSTAANAAIVSAGTSGAISVFATETTDLIIDINGYFAPPPGGLAFFTFPPCRTLDTRKPAGAPPINELLMLNVTANVCGVPASAQAYLFNATVVPPGSLGFLTLWPNGTPQPGTSTLNAFDGAVTSNMAIVATTNGSVNAFVSAPTHLIMDIFGYFAPAP